MTIFFIKLKIIKCKLNLQTHILNKQWYRIVVFVLIQKKKPDLRALLKMTMVSVAELLGIKFQVDESR